MRNNGRLRAKSPSAVVTSEELAERLLDRVLSMTPRQRQASLVKAGICTKEGRLRRRYGGVAP